MGLEDQFPLGNGHQWRWNLPHYTNSWPPIVSQHCWTQTPRSQHVPITRIDGQSHVKVLKSTCEWVKSQTHSKYFKIHNPDNLGGMNIHIISSCFGSRIEHNYSGWWFGTWILWLSIQLGMSPSQLTNSYVSRWLEPPTSYCFFTYFSTTQGPQGEAPRPREGCAQCRALRNLRKTDGKPKKGYVGGRQGGIDRWFIDDLQMNFR